MIEALQPYADYKESGLPWLEMIPRHWRTARNGILFQQRNDTRFPELPILEVSLRTGVRIREFSSSKRKQVMADASKYKRACVGDLAYNMMRMWQGAVGVAPVDGLVSPAYVVARPFPGTQSSYYTALFKCELYMGEIDAVSRGIVKDRNRLYWDQFKQMQSLAPPPDEQAAIVKFLDYANGKIERAIRAKRKLIGLLNEQKQAIIHHAVTRGLDPNVKLKPSGIPWLGDVPEHWEVRRLKSVLARNDGGVWGSDFAPDGTIVLRSTEQAIDGSWQIDDPAVIRLPDGQVKSALLEVGDIVVTKSSGSPNHIGKSSLVTREIAEMRCCYSNFMQRLRTAHELAPEYLNLFLNSKTGRMHYQYSSTSTTGLGNLTRETIATLPIPVPDRSEQARVLDGVRRSLEPIEEAASRLEREIELLCEYRTTLTAEVVTGKLDVREASKRLPDQTDEPLPPDESQDDLVDDEITEEDEA
jgi:type I restriction enzyme S subunit